MIDKLGFIGIGNMGLPMALRLIEAGYGVTVFDIQEDAIRPVAARGARVANSPADVASEVGTVLVSLPTPDVVKEVALGPEGIVNGSTVRIFVDLSTTGPTVAELVASELGAREISVLDAPVSGGVSGAEKGTLTVMVSGARSVFDELRHLCWVSRPAWTPRSC